MERKNNVVLKFIGIAMLLAACIIIATPAPAQAATAKKKVSALTETMWGYEFYALYQADGDGPAVVNVKLNNKQKAKAAALAVDVSDLDCIEIMNGEYGLYLIDNDEIRKNTKNMFGKAIDATALSEDPECIILDAIVFGLEDAEVAARYEALFETELDYDVRNTKITKSGKNYKVVKNVFFGTWHENDGKTSNYSIQYTVKKSAASKYGYAITAMKITAK